MNIKKTSLKRKYRLSTFFMRKRLKRPENPKIIVPETINAIEDNSSLLLSYPEQLKDVLEKLGLARIKMKQNVGMTETIANNNI